MNVSPATDIPAHGTARERFDIHRARITAIASALTVGQDVTATDRELGDLIGVPHWHISAARRLMVHIGVLEFRQGGPNKPGHWRLLKDGPLLDHAIDLEMERQMRGGLSPEAVRRKNTKKSRRLTRQSAERVAVMEDRLGFAVAAVAGPDRPEPLRTSLVGSGPNAPAALVLAAKQYRHGLHDPKQRKAAELVKELTEIGVSVPPDLAAKAAPRKDDRLEAIALVLPYIEELERNLVQANDTLRAQADYGDLKQRVEKQRSQIERLIATRTADAMTERPHHS